MPSPPPFRIFRTSYGPESAHANGTFFYFFLNNESARLLPDKRHSKVGTRPEAFHNVCQNWPFFQPFWNQTGHQIWIGLESVSLISSFIQCEFCYLLSEKLLIFWKVLSNHTCWSCSSVLFYFIRMLCTYFAASRGTFFRIISIILHRIHCKKTCCFH